VSHRLHSRFVVLACLVSFFLLSALFSAQQTDDPPKPAQSQETAPPVMTFKTRSDLVLVPVVVRDRKGNHVSSLTKDAFHLEENGIEQHISLFEEVHTSNVDAKPYQALELGYSNLPFGNAKELLQTILVLDLLNTSALQREDGRDDFVKLLSKGITANQPVSLVCITSKGLKLVQPFATDPNSLVSQLKKLPLRAESIMARESHHQHHRPAS
jgi:VWFA-related protein